MRPEIAAKVATSAGNFTASNGADKLMQGKLKDQFAESFPKAAIDNIKWYPAVPAGIEEIEGKILDRLKAGSSPPLVIIVPRLVRGGDFCLQRPWHPPPISTSSTSRSASVPAAVNNVTFSVAPGEFFPDSRPLGLRQDHAHAHDRRLRGTDLGRHPYPRHIDDRRSGNRRPVNMVFQSLALFPMMSVGENVAYGLTCRRVSVLKPRNAPAGCWSASVSRGSASVV